MGFLTRDANGFECYDDKTDTWHNCDKKEICDNQLGPDRYRPIKDDEYLDNWATPEKFDTLCTEKYKIGLLGSIYFCGLVSTVFFYPLLSDSCLGRPAVIIPALLIQLIGMIGLLITTELNDAYIYFFLIGTAFPARVILALTYLIEFNKVRFHTLITRYFLYAEPFIMIGVTFYYQFIDKGWIALQITSVVVLFLVILWYIIVVPESPKWLYTNLRFAESRESLKKVAKFNLHDSEFISDFFSFRFDSELGQFAAMSLKSGRTNSGFEMSTGRYVGNIIIMTIFWSSASFSFYLVQFLTKYYEGNLYLNFYLDGLAGLIGVTLSTPLYNWAKMKYTYITSISLTLISILFLFLFQEKYISSHWVQDIGAPESGHPEGSY